MRLVIVGSGTGIPINDRAAPSLLLQGAGQPVLMDIGPGTLRRLAALGIKHEHIGQIFISHLHPDHTADLIHFLFATKYPFVLEQRAPFTITGPRGLGEFLSNLQKAYKKWLNIPPEIMEIEELDLEKPEQRSYGHLQLRSHHIRHSPESLAYRIEGPQGETLVYSGDTGFCDEIIDLAKDVDLLILECSFPDGEPMDGHLTPSSAGRIAALANAGKLVLLHFYPEVLRTEIVNSCRRAFQGELILGRDSLHISI